MRFTLGFLTGAVVVALMFWLWPRAMPDAPVAEEPTTEAQETAPPPEDVIRRLPTPPDDRADTGLIVPVEGVARRDLVDTFAQSREDGARGHDAIDIMAPAGTPVIAAAAGRVEKLFASDDGGLTIYIRTPDRRRVHYYAHLQRYAPGLVEGMAVRQGQRIGRVGSTGNADPAAPHLHFAIQRMRGDEGWWEGEPINPFPLLRAGRG